MGEVEDVAEDIEAEARAAERADAGEEAEPEEEEADEANSIEVAGEVRAKHRGGTEEEDTCFRCATTPLALTGRGEGVIERADRGIGQ